MSSINPGRTEEPLPTSSQPAGLTTDFRITTMNVTDVAAPVPAAALTSRVGVSITNLDPLETVYIGKITVTADRVLGTTAGWEIGPNESLNFDVGDSLILYGRAELGKTILIKVLEIS